MGVEEEGKDGRQWLQSKVKGLGDYLPVSPCYVPQNTLLDYWMLIHVGDSQKFMILMNQGCRICKHLFTEVVKKKV